MVETHLNPVIVSATPRPEEYKISVFYGSCPTTLTLQSGAHEAGADLSLVFVEAAAEDAAR